MSILRNVPPPQGSKPPTNAYQRFIPREELGNTAPWNLGSFGGQTPGTADEPGIAAASPAAAAEPVRPAAPDQNASAAVPQPAPPPAPQAAEPAPARPAAGAGMIRVD
ncbi:MAG: hypothetical protein ACOVOT_16075, partial [Rubrivivax sp.]